MKKIVKILILLGVLFVGSSTASNIEKFNEDYYTQICKKLVSCQSSYRVAETLMMMQVKDVDDCVKKLSSRDSAKAWKTSLNRKQITFNAKNVPACLAAVSELTCETIAKRVFKSAGIKGCEKVIEGTVLDFKKCVSHLECSNAQATCYDTCQPPRFLQCGETMGEELCSTSQYCDTKQHKCFSLNKVGDKCTNFSECETRNCSDNICKDYPSVRKAGESCGRDFSNVCIMGYYCSDDTNKCVAF